MSDHFGYWAPLGVCVYHVRASCIQWGIDDSIVSSTYVRVWC